jgi:hypothetical protein
MRKILFTLLTTAALLAAVPVLSLARDGEHHRGDRHREREHHHGRAHDERSDGIARRDLHRDAGTVSALANRRLTIQLRDGTSVTGALSRFTRVECERLHSARVGHRGSAGSGAISAGDRSREDRGSANDDRGSGNDANDDRGHSGGRDRGERRCATIAPGARVRAAVLDVTAHGAVWVRIDLGA